MQISFTGPNVKGLKYSRMADLMHQPDFTRNVENDYSEGKIPNSQKIKIQAFEYYRPSLQEILCPNDYAAQSILEHSCLF